MSNAKRTKPIDLADLDTGVASDKGFEFELLHPTKQTPTGAFITVLGKHSQAYREHIRETGNDRMRRAAAAERKGKPVDPVTIEQAEQGALELLVVCTTAFRNVTYKGEELPFNTANALKLYGDQIWIRKQVDDAIDDLENFM